MLGQMGSLWTMWVYHILELPFFPHLQHLTIPILSLQIMKCWPVKSHILTWIQVSVSYVRLLQLMSVNVSGVFQLYAIYICRHQKIMTCGEYTEMWSNKPCAWTVWLLVVTFVACFSAVWTCLIHVAVICSKRLWSSNRDTIKYDSKSNIFLHNVSNIMIVKGNYTRMHHLSLVLYAMSLVLYAMSHHVLYY